MSKQQKQTAAQITPRDGQNMSTRPLSFECPSWAGKVPKDWKSSYCNPLLSSPVSLIVTCTKNNHIYGMTLNLLRIRRVPQHTFQKRWHSIKKKKKVINLRSKWEEKLLQKKLFEVSVNTRHHWWREKYHCKYRFLIKRKTQEVRHLKLKKRNSTLILVHLFCNSVLSFPIRINSLNKSRSPQKTKNYPF